MTAYIICLIVGYFCGCISMGYFVGRFYHMDIRTKGSGNAGTTNVLRNLGKIPALITFAGDLAKAMRKIKIEGLTGELTWNDEGQVEKPATAYVIQDGKYIAA